MSSRNQNQVTCESCQQTLQELMKIYPRPKHVIKAIGIAADHIRLQILTRLKNQGVKLLDPYNITSTDNYLKQLAKSLPPNNKFNYYDYVEQKKDISISFFYLRNLIV